MKSAVRIGALGGAVLLALLAASAPAAAAPKPIAGELSKPGYEVIALATGGEATSALTKPREFRLRPPAKRVSLHLRAADGTYAGPVVVGKERKGKRVILGVKAGTKLGEVEIKAARGYAKLAEKPPEESLDPEQEARARKGVPIGAGVFGRVLSPAASGPLADPDFDGLPDPLDIDDDGDLVLDNVDPSAASRALRSASANQFHLASSLALPIHDTVNANSPAFTDEQIEAALPSFGVIIVQILPGAAAELDCGGLLYCSLGGTGRYPTNLNPPEGPPFPGDFDADNDGFGRLTLTPGARGSMFLLHGARAREPDLDPTTSQIGTGDMLFEHVTTSGDESQCPQPVQVPECASFLSTLQFTFATVPALVSFSDETGETMVPYPIAGPYSGPPEGFRPSGPGTHNNGFPVTDGPDDDQDVELTFTFWRPQRRPIPDELCPPPPDRPCTANEWIDIGGLTYSPVVQHLGSPGAPGGMEVAQGCPESTLSSTDPRLSETSPEAGAPGGFTDQALDQPASDTNTFTYTLNLTQCLASLGISSWDPGQELDLTFAAKDDSFDTTNQGVTFKRQP